MKPIPYLKKDAYGITLMVDDQPFLALGGELHNSSGSDLHYMETVVWPALRQLGGNCYLTPAYWECIEPEPGKYDFSLVDGVILQARREGVKLMLLWFGTWKNGASDYVPLWLKADKGSYFLAEDENGVPLHTISPFCDTVLEKDAAAFTALMEHLAVFDAEDRTVIMVQVENEVGIWWHDRDFCDIANQLFAAEVPQDVAETYQVSGNWTAAFGVEAACDTFMAWAYSRAIEKVAAVGKAAYDLPLFCNCVPMGMGFCPAGGPDASVHHIWKKFAPSIDVLSPDIYAPTFREITGRFHHETNPLFIPETSCDQSAASRLIYAMGAHNCMGFHPFAIEDTFAEQPAIDFASNGFAKTGQGLTGVNLREAYQLIWALWPEIRQAHAKGRIHAFLQQSGERSSVLMLNDLRIHVGYGLPRVQEDGPAAAGFLIETGKDAFLFCGINCTLSFSPARGSNETIFVMDKRELRLENGKLVTGRSLNGDERNQTGIGKTPAAITFSLYRH